MLNLNAMVTETEYQRRKLLNEATNWRLAQTVKESAAGTAKRRLSFSLNLFNRRSREVEDYTGAARQVALKSR